jgi:hypothetical protein
VPHNRRTFYMKSGMFPAFFRRGQLAHRLTVRRHTRAVSARARRPPGEDSHRQATQEVECLIESMLI